jgi:iron complex transport system substrate-binding protein
MDDIEEVARCVVDTGYRLHRDLGPGLLESAYEAILSEQLLRRGLRVDRQKPIDIRYDEVFLPHAFRLDMLIEDRLIVEIKSTERFMPVHAKQLLTYLRLTGHSLGLLINFGAPTFKEGVKRVVNGHDDLASSRLRVSPSTPSQRR